MIDNLTPDPTGVAEKASPHPGEYPIAPGAKIPRDHRTPACARGGDSFLAMVLLLLGHHCLCLVSSLMASEDVTGLA